MHCEKQLNVEERKIWILFNKWCLTQVVFIRAFLFCDTFKNDCFTKVFFNF